MKKPIGKPVRFDMPVVVIPQEEYEQLLKEAGYRATPALDKEIQEARRNLKKEKYITWEKAKRELIEL